MWGCRPLPEFFLGQLSWGKCKSCRARSFSQCSHVQWHNLGLVFVVTTFSEVLSGAVVLRRRKSFTQEAAFALQVSQISKCQITHRNSPQTEQKDEIEISSCRSCFENAKTQSSELWALLIMSNTLPANSWYYTWHQCGNLPEMPQHCVSCLYHQDADNWGRYRRQVWVFVHTCLVP